MKKAMQFLEEHFKGHDVVFYDMDDAVYVEDNTEKRSYTYIVASGRLIAHEEA